MRFRSTDLEEGGTSGMHAQLFLGLVFEVWVVLTPHKGHNVELSQQVPAILEAISPKAVRPKP